MAAASARLCVETLHFYAYFYCFWQPPPRGCVLKHGGSIIADTIRGAAASARLCVETPVLNEMIIEDKAAASARLCVETIITQNKFEIVFAAASARLCVETVFFCSHSRHQAAASARLCVETKANLIFWVNNLSSRLRAAVC